MDESPHERTVGSWSGLISVMTKATRDGAVRKRFKHVMAPSNEKPALK